MKEMRICAYDGCKEPFEATRSDNVFHTPSCRTMASKQRKASEEGDGVADPGEAAPDEVVVSPSVADRTALVLAVADRAVPDARLERLAQRVTDLEQDFDLAEPVWQRLKEQKPMTPEDVDAVVQRKIAAALAPIVRRLETAERAVRKDAERPRPVVVARDGKVDEMERAMIVLARKIASVRNDLDVLTEGIAGIDADDEAA